MNDSKPLVIVGASTRAAAQSARRAGFDPWCIDRFADRDLQRIAEVRLCPTADYPLGILKLLDDAPRAPVLLTGAMENHPQVLQAIELERPLWGCSASAIAAVRDPSLFQKPPAISGVVWPRVKRGSIWLNLTRRLHIKPLSRSRYLLKPIRSAGGVGIEHWSPAHKVDHQHVLQERMAGQPISAVYRADGWSSRLLGVTQQLIADQHFGTVHPYQYCGSLGPLDLPASVTAALVQLGVVLTQRFDMRGVFGVDAILSADRHLRIHPIEINPRYTASVEVIERATGGTALGSISEMRKGEPTSRIHGKAIVFARDGGSTPDLYDLFDSSRIADVSPIGQPIVPGGPICTVFASGHDEADCLGRLHAMAERLYTRLRT